MKIEAIELKEEIERGPVRLIDVRTPAEFEALHIAGSELMPLDRLDPDRPGSAPRWLGFDDPAQQVAALATTPHAVTHLWGSFNSLELMAAATRSGLGIGTLPCYLGDRDPALQRIERSAIGVGADVWLLCHPDLRTTVRLKALRSAVQDAMEGLAPLFAGEEAAVARARASGGPPGARPGGA